MASKNNKSKNNKLKNDNIKSYYNLEPCVVNARMDECMADNMIIPEINDDRWEDIGELDVKIIYNCGFGEFDEFDIGIDSITEYAELCKHYPDRIAHHHIGVYGDVFTIYIVSDRIIKTPLLTWTLNSAMRDMKEKLYKYSKGNNDEFKVFTNCDKLHVKVIGYVYTKDYKIVNKYKDHIYEAYKDDMKDKSTIKLKIKKAPKALAVNIKARKTNKIDEIRTSLINELCLNEERLTTCGDIFIVDNINKEKQNNILALKDACKEYFVMRKWTSFGKMNVNDEWLSLSKSILREYGFAIKLINVPKIDAHQIHIPGEPDETVKAYFVKKINM